MRRIFYAAATVVAAGALALTGASAAGAATAARPKATPACTVVFTNCQTPVAAIAANPANDLTPSSDVAMRYTGPNPAAGAAYGNISSYSANNLQDGTEDFSWTQVATVPASGAGAYKFTGFDNANYNGDHVYEAEYTPKGRDTGLCLTVSSRYRSNGLVLGNCIAAAQQVYIVTQTAPNLAPLAGPTSSYWYAFDTTHFAGNTQQHLALVDPHAGTDGLLAVGNAVHVAAGKAAVDLWSSVS